MSARSSPVPELRHDPLIGTRIAGRYRIDRVHARGGMSVVYAATYEAQQREVAIKVIDEAHAGDPQAVERFVLEARTASSVSHGHVVGVSDYGRLPNGRPYLVMPMIMGQDLATLIAEHGPLPAVRVANLLSGVASALDWMHGQGLVHRDIKSENIMYVRGDDGTESALVLDFGIVAAARASVTAEDEDTSGTPDFMAPEVLAGEPSDHRADVYSLATVAFELLTGRLPFQGNDLSELLRSRSSDPPRTLSEASQLSFHPALEAALARGLARDARDRPGSAGAFVRELTRAAARARSPLTAPPPKGKNEPAARPRAPTLPARGRRLARLRTLVGFPFKASANTTVRDVTEPQATPVREPSIVVDLALPAMSAKAPQPEAPEESGARLKPIAPPQAPPAPDAAPQAQPATQPKLQQPPPAPAAERPPSPQAVDSLRPLTELDLEVPAPPTHNRWLRVGLPAAAAIAALTIALWNGSDEPSSPAGAPTRAPEPAQTSTAAPSAAPPAASAPAPEQPMTRELASSDTPAAVLAPLEPKPAPAEAKPEPSSRSSATSKAKASERAAPRTRRERAVERPAIVQPQPIAANARELTRDGVDAMLRGEFSAALAKLDAALAASPRYAPALRGKGLVLERMGRTKDAANAFRLYLRVAPGAADAAKIQERLDALE